jgi:phosphatidylinositol phosphate synthase
MFDGRWRDTVDRGTGPVGRRLQQVGISADVLTATGLVSAAATAAAVATGHLHLALVLLILTGMHDLLDGPVAKASGTTSVRGAFFDSVTDRVADALILGGIAWYLVSTHPGHLVLLPFAVLAVTSLVSYQRAKAESLGISAKGGLMERAERMILLGVGFLTAAFLVPVLWIMFALTTATAVGRFVKVWRLAEAPAPSTARRARRTRAGMRASGRGAIRTPGRTGSTSASRWRARRQGELSSRSGRTWRARQARTGTRQRTGRRHG